jgi:hypothetical protein
MRTFLPVLVKLMEATLPNVIQNVRKNVRGIRLTRIASLWIPPEVDRLSRVLPLHAQRYRTVWGEMIAQKHLGRSVPQGRIGKMVMPLPLQWLVPEQ